MRRRRRYNGLRRAVLPPSAEECQRGRKILANLRLRDTGMKRRSHKQPQQQNLEGE
jgi:hypothetical protein